jgi:ATP-dependent Clp protease ATP-binding subunit ClpA
MFETFTASARAAIERAQREAREMGHGAVEVEHLLLGLLDR